MLEFKHLEQNNVQMVGENETLKKYFSDEFCLENLIFHTARMRITLLNLTTEKTRCIEIKVAHYLLFMLSPPKPSSSFDK